jgi:hypothetical protein
MQYLIWKYCLEEAHVTTQSNATNTDDAGQNPTIKQNDGSAKTDAVENPLSTHHGTETIQTGAIMASGTSTITQGTQGSISSTFAPANFPTSLTSSPSHYSITTTPPYATISSTTTSSNASSSTTSTTTTTTTTTAVIIIATTKMQWKPWNLFS